MRVLLIFLIFIFLFFVNCNRPDKRNNQSSVDKETDENIASKFFNDIQIPKGLTLDSLIIKNNEKRAEFKIVLLKSINNSFDSFVKDSLIKMNNKFLSGIDKEFLKTIDSIIKEGSNRAKEPSYFYAKPLQAWIDSAFMSYNFAISNYLVESSHPVDLFCSFNYDRKADKAIGFNDYFDLKTHKDSLLLIDLINRAIDIKDVSIAKVENFKFNIVLDTIRFNFSDYEISSYSNGLIQASILKKDIKRIINKNYR
jgi:hypothetical protein